jgi:RNA polymerase sigma factor (sigma-70 family)
MAIGSAGSFPKHFQTLFTSGPVGDLADGALLERFAATRDEAAFEVLVARHGPMVLRVCRAALLDSNEADDAFQAVFIVLVRRAAAIRSRASVASWLFGVASKISARARVEASRRRRHEREAATTRSTTLSECPGPQPDPFVVLHEELAGLPDPYREAIVLCYLEGHTCDDAARRLRRPVGTVKARLSRARGILKRRLIRRGIALPAGLVAAGATVEAPAAQVPSGLLKTTVTSALGCAAGASVASARVVSLADGAIKLMSLQKLKIAVLVSLPLAIAAGSLAMAYGLSAPRDEPRGQAQGSGGKPSARPVSATLDAPVATPDAVALALKDALPAATAAADPYAFTFVLIRLAKAQHASGDREAALGTFRLADQVAGTVKDEHHRRLALLRTAVARGRIGDSAPARATLESFAAEASRLRLEERYNLMSMVIDFLFDAGFKAESKARLDAELAAVDRIADERIRDGGIHRLIYNQIHMEDYDGALRQAERYTDSKSNTRASLLGIIMTYARSKGPPRAVVERALELSREVTYPYPRALAQVHIAAALARAGDIEGALVLARGLASDGNNLEMEINRSEIPRAMAEIAREQAKAGAIDAAKATLREALEVAKTVPQHGGVLFDRVRRVAEVQCEIADLEGVKASADFIVGEPSEKVLAMVSVARAQVKAGDASSARATLRDALKLAGEVGPRANVINDDPTANADRVFKEIAIAQAEVGDGKGALETVASRGFDDWRSETLSAIAPIQARLGDMPAALATIRSIPIPARAAQAYAALASVQAKSGAEPATLAWIARLDDPTARSFALIGIIEGRAAREAEKGKEAKAKP